MNILLVDDDLFSRSSVGEFLRETGHHVVECTNGQEALTLLNNYHFHMVMSDIKMPVMNGLDLLRNLSLLAIEQKPDVVLFTGHGDLNSAIEALRAGAYDYLLKPINVGELAAITERIAEHQALRQENRVLTEHFEDELKAATEQTRKELVKLKKMVSQSFGLDKYGFFSEKILNIVNQAQKYHQDRAIPVLIQGETGTGKEIIARIIHFGSLDIATPFVDINCAAITPSLFESELFGYEAGAFTGSLGRGQKGKLDLADGGTIFLDEVAEIPLELQGKLLRVIQEKEFYRVGGLRKISTDLRFICATNRDLKQMVDQGRFRQDLYYRLKVGELVLPPLRSRPEEIIPLAEMFLKELAKKKGKLFQFISKQAKRILTTHLWPGNIRELRNTIEWAVFMYDGHELLPDHLSMLTNEIQSQENITDETQVINPYDLQLPTEGLDLETLVNSVVMKALEINNGNKTETARYLGITRRTLYSRLDRINNIFAGKAETN